MNRNLHRCALRFERTASAAFRDASYGAAIERPAPKSGGVLRWIVFSVMAVLALALIAGGV